MSCPKHKIMETIGKPHLACLATITKSGKPWVRYVMAVADGNMTIRFATFLNARKVSHIRKYPEVHLTCGVTNPEKYNNYLQIQGKAEISTNKSEKESYWCEKLEEIFESPDDPSYGIIIVKPYRIELYSKESMTPEIWEE
ncbi:MAG: pyridoxamine 5'-phosphate oxidase family protein [Candidatus Theseobacter exili]|nr:pyridoxamine 5'-phosphate oxidase family protein [Candidatus Theseobacter exili]